MRSYLGGGLLRLWACKTDKRMISTFEENIFVFHSGFSDKKKFQFLGKENSTMHATFLSNRELVRRKNLLQMFKLWKKRKQRLWSIVVTERAKKEMIKEDAANEKSKL